MLTRRMQIQVIANRLAGLEQKGVKLRDFEEPWKSANRVITESPPDAAQQALVKEMSRFPDRDAIIGAILAAVPGEMRQKFPSLAEIAAELPPVEWLWPDWVPRGMLSLLGAAPGAGKSFVALDLARRIIGGETFPDGAPVARPGANVIYVDAEAVPQLLNERAEAWEMDRSRLFLLLPLANDLIDFAHQAYQEQLVEMMHALNPELVVIDSLSSVSSKGENSVEDVREILAFLNAVAVDFQCGLLLIHHLRKRSPLAMMDLLGVDDFRGSSHIIAIARSVLGLSIIQHTQKVDRNGPRRLEVIKTNLARYPEPIGIEFAPLHPKGMVLRYGDAPAPYQEPTETDLCAEWLLDVLKECGPLKPKGIVEMAEEAGFSKTTVYRARDSLGDQVVNTAGRKSPDNEWMLSQGESEAGTEQVSTEVDRCAAWLLAALRERGQLKPEDVMEMAEAAGFSRATVYRARKTLADQIENTHRQHHSDNQWTLSEM